MNEPEINRLREDLEAIRQAAGLDLPFNRRDVWILTPVGCIAGAVIACMGWWVPVEYKWVALFPAAIVLGVWLVLARSAHRRRATEPVYWRETRYGLLFLLLFMPVLVGFIVWEATMGAPRAVIQTGAAFFPGLGLAWFGVIDRTRRYYIGGALPLIIFGLMIPFCDPRQIRAGAGLMLIAIGLLTAAIQMWQLRNQRSDTDAN